ncbi:TRAP transporter small permease [uncultured Cohaesibacter sp.]|uniref:TRAP transporter small permease n=1 Tax=uncultured Cohaesibacter sp. TaxID=1002546 RepID=UPI002AAB0F46|nr:TRAP transporter small permease [uncultured Cohaesibacter sp.]
MEKLDTFIHRTLLWIIASLMFVMMGLTFTQVVARYLMHHSLSWSEEVGRYVFVWISFLGLAAAFRSGAHVALDILSDILSPAPRRVLAVINTSFIFILAIALFFGGIALMKFGMNQRSPALDLPMYLVYLVIPFSGIALGYFALRAVWGHLTAKLED